MDGFASRVPADRRIYPNRTLNLRNIAAVGFDMDYTLVHYDPQAWEGAAFAAAVRLLRECGIDLSGVSFDAQAFTRGLVLDLELGNIVKANRFGYPKRASHGYALLDWPTHRSTYERTFVDLREDRWVFLNTLFSLSEAQLFAELVERVDQGSIPGVRTYAEAFRLLADTLRRVHTEGHIKDAVTADPGAFIVPDPETPLALLDLHHAGKKLALITNSEWSYTQAVMSHTFDPYLGGASWRSLFDILIVAARKPAFFTGEHSVYRVADTERGLLEPYSGPLEQGEAYHGGCASMVERAFGLSGESILYIGDHVFADVNVSKKLLRWRTGLVVRELESEVRPLPQTAQIDLLMEDKRALEHQLATRRLMKQRHDAGYGPQPTQRCEVLEAEVADLRARIEAIDAEVAPLLIEQSQLGNARWGPLFRAGNDKSHFARQVERYADFYTSRVSNLLHATPYAYLRAPRGLLPHDERESSRRGTGS